MCAGLATSLLGSDEVSGRSLLWLLMKDVESRLVIEVKLAPEGFQVTKVQF